MLVNGLIFVLRRIALKLTGCVILCCVTSTENKAFVFYFMSTLIHDIIEYLFTRNEDNRKFLPSTHHIPLNTFHYKKSNK